MLHLWLDGGQLRARQRAFPDLFCARINHLEHAGWLLLLFQLTGALLCSPRGSAGTQLPPWCPAGTAPSSLGALLLKTQRETWPEVLPPSKLA